MRIPGNVYSNAQIAPRTARTDGAASARADQGKDAASGQAAPRTENVTVEVSSTAKALANGNALDTAKVDRLRAAIASGSFAIDHQAIAASIAQTGG